MYVIGVSKMVKLWEYATTPNENIQQYILT